MPKGEETIQEPKDYQEFLSARRRYMAEILHLAVSISETTEADVFVEYVTHVNWFTVDIFRRGWDEGTKDGERVTDYTTQIPITYYGATGVNSEAQKEVLNRLSEALDTLETLAIELQKGEENA